MNDVNAKYELKRKKQLQSIQEISAWKISFKLPVVLFVIS